MKNLNKPTPIWLTMLLLCFCFVAIGGAATTLYTGSFTVASSGHITDSNTSATAPVCYNASHQLTSTCSGVSPTYTNVSATSTIIAGSGTAPSTNAGDLAASTGVSAGNVQLGGVTNHGTLGFDTGIWTLFNGATADFISDASGNATALGTLKAAKASGSTTTYVPPMYTAAGAVQASTTHGVIISCATGSNGFCSVSLTNAAVFNSSTSYACGLSVPGASGADYAKSTINATTVTLAIYTSAGALDTAYNNTLTATCIGT